MDICSQFKISRVNNYELVSFITNKSVEKAFRHFKWCLSALSRVSVYACTSLFEFVNYFHYCGKYLLAFQNSEDGFTARGSRECLMTRGGAEGCCPRC